MENDPSIIKEKIKTYIQQTTHFENDQLKEDSLFFKEGYLDSMGFIMLITFIEDEFALRTSDDELIEDNFESINAIAAYVLRKKSN